MFFTCLHLQPLSRKMVLLKAFYCSGSSRKLWVLGVSLGHSNYSNLEASLIYNQWEFQINVLGTGVQDGVQALPMFRNLVWVCKVFVLV